MSDLTFSPSQLLGLSDIHQGAVDAITMAQGCDCTPNLGLAASVAAPLLEAGRAYLTQHLGMHQPLVSELQASASDYSTAEARMTNLAKAAGKLP